MNPQPKVSSEILRSDWKLKHAYARIFYSTFKSKMVKLWKKTSAGKSLRPSVWVNFVESPELWKMTWNKFATLSAVTMELCAHAELPDDAIEAVTKENEIYCLVPFATAMIPAENGSPLESIEKDATGIGTPRRYACQQFLKTVLIYFFADLYQKKFTVHSRSHEDMEVDKNTINAPLFLGKTSSAP